MEILLTTIGSIVAAYFTFMNVKNKERNSVQKFYMEKVEELIHRQESEISKLSGKIELVTNENKALRQTIVQLKDVISHLREENAQLSDEIKELSKKLEVND